MNPKPIHVSCKEYPGNGHGGGEWDEEKIGDDGEVVKVGMHLFLILIWIMNVFLFSFPSYFVL